MPKLHRDSSERIQWSQESQERNDLSVSAANANFTEVQEHATAAHGTTKFRLGAEAGEKKNLIDLALKFRARRPRENLVVDHLSLRIESGLEEQSTRVCVAVTTNVRYRERGKAFELRGLYQIQWQIVSAGANRQPDEHSLRDEQENGDRRQHTTSGRKGQRLEDILRYEKRPAPNLARHRPPRPLARCLHTNPHRQVGRRKNRLNLREMAGKNAVAFKFAAAASARLEMAA